MDKWLIRKKDSNNNPAASNGSRPVSSTSKGTPTESLPVTSATNVPVDVPVASDINALQESSVEAVSSTSTDSVPSKKLKLDKVHKFQSEWIKKWPWLNYQEDKGMTCTLCLKQKKGNSLTTGSHNYHTSTLDRHVVSADHRQAVNECSMTKEFTLVNNFITYFW